MASLPTRSATTTTATEDEALNLKVSASALDFLLIELVPLAQRITEQLHAQERTLLEQYQRTRKLLSTVGANRSQTQDAASEESQDRRSETVITSLGFPFMSEKTREGVLFRLDTLGYRVGQGLAERFSAGKPRPVSSLDCIKFVCKDLWILVFRKQIDNLKTNHRGIFVLTDNRFHPLSKMSVDRRAGAKAVEESLSRAQTHLYFPCGIIRGALAALGVEAQVDASSMEIPTAVFQIKSSAGHP